MSLTFPRTEIEGKSLSRMIIGTNWVLGYSHRSSSADNLIRSRYDSAEQISRLIVAFMNQGVDTIMGLIAGAPMLADAIKIAEDKTGRGMVVIDTPIVDVSDTVEARAATEAAIKKSASLGCDFCLLHHSSVEQLVNKNKREITRLDDYTRMIRDAGMIPGLSAHMPEIITYCDLNDYDVQTYIQIYNCLGFLMQIEVESVANIINNAKKPVMCIKSMAAGRTTPFVGFNFVWNTIRDCDMVTVGCFSEDEVNEDVEMSRAILERRYYGAARRSSPNLNQDVFGQK